uniref:Putative serine-type enodpeptidase n=1 Tax=Anopheles darlingi TaxID=43151 RepID=A0A2M4D1J1_ANODA
MDLLGVGCVVTVAAISQGDDLGVQELQMVRDTNIGSKLAPSGSGCTSTGDEVSAKSDRLYSGIVGDEGSGLHQRNIVGQRIGVIARVVHDTGGGMANTSTVQEDGSNHGESVSGGTANGAVSRGQHVAVVDDGSAAEMRIASRSQRHLEGELVRSSVLASHDTSSPLGKLWRQSCGKG